MNAPTQYEVKLLLDDVIPHGVRQQIAEELGVTEGDISRRFNPNDDRKCGIGEALRELIALKNADPQAFQTVRAFIDNTLNAEDRGTSRDLSQLMGSVAKETADVVCAELEGKPAHIRRKEAVEAGAALRKYESRLSECALRKVG